MRRMGRFRVTEELLRDVLGMPEGTQIFHIHRGESPHGFEFIVEHPDLPEVIEGAKAPKITPEITETGERPPRHWLEWDWNLPDDDG